MVEAKVRDRFLNNHGSYGEWWQKLTEEGFSLAEVFTDGETSHVAIYEPGAHRDEAVLLIEELAEHGAGVQYLITDECKDAGLCDTYGIARMDCGALTPEHGVDFIVVLSDDIVYSAKTKMRGKTDAEIISLDGLIALVYFKYFYYSAIAKMCAAFGAKLCVLEWAYVSDFKNPELYEVVYKGPAEPMDFQANPEHLKKLYDDIDEYSPGYIREIFTERPIISRQGKRVHADCRGKHVNIVNNRRYTVGQPDDAEQEVHLFGGCNAFGFGTDDRYTMASALQGLINGHYGSAKDSKCSVYNWGVWGAGDDMTEDILRHSNRKKVLLYLMRGDFLYPKGSRRAFRYIKAFMNELGADYIDLTDTLERAEEQSGVYIDVAHVNHRGHRAVAETVFADYIKPMLDMHVHEETSNSGLTVPDDLSLLVSDLARCAHVCMVQWLDAHEVMTQPLPNATDYGYYAVHLYNDVPEVSPMYLKEVLMQTSGATVKKKDAAEIKNADIKGKYVTVTGGERKTVGQPSACDRRVFVFGDGVAFGFGADDRFTIASVLQELLNNHSARTPDALRYSVINEGIWNGGQSVPDAFILKNKILPKLDSGGIKRDDIILWFQNKKYTAEEKAYLESHGFCCLDLTSALQMGQKSKPLFVDKRHANHRGYKMAATKIYFDYINGIPEDLPQVDRLFPTIGMRSFENIWLIWRTKKQRVRVLSALL